MTLPFQIMHDGVPYAGGNGDKWSVARLVGNRVDGICMMTGVNRHGARLISVLDLAVGEEIMLDIGGDVRLAARVRWIEGAVTGIGFVTPLPVGEDSCPVRIDGSGDSGGEVARKLPRFRRCVPVVLERHGREQAGELVDISQFGACVVTPSRPWLRLGGNVTLEIEGCDPIEAEVRWEQDGRIGLAFRSFVQLWKLDKRLQEWARTCEDCTSAECRADAGGQAVRGGGGAGPIG